MKKVKKLAALGLSLALTAGLMTGCGSSNNGGTTSSTPDSAATSSAPSSEDNGGTSDGGRTYNGVDISEHVDLKMYLLGDRSADFDEVYGEINKILEEKLNCSISVDFLSWGEHEAKYSLLFSSQEDFDLIFTASGWAHYEQTVNLGGFYALSEDFIKTYAPEIWEAVPQMAWDQAKIDGEMYMVPNYQNEFGQETIAVRGDLMEKYDITDISDWESLKNFYLTVAENETGIYASQGDPWYQYFQYNGMSGVSGTPKSGEMILYNTMDPSNLDFVSIVDWDGFVDYCKEVKELADAGCWSKDVLSDNAERQEGFLKGTVASMLWNKGTCLYYAKEANKENPDWNCLIFDPVSNQPKRVNSYINNGVGININSKYKERALMVLNEFYTNQEVNDLSRFGIEGKHWQAVGDDQYMQLDESTFGVDNNCNWGWMNADIKRTEFIEDRTALDDQVDAMGKLWDNNVKAEHIYDGFTFNNSNVTTQVAAVEAIVDSYLKPLRSGLVSDVDASIADLRKALDNAGMQDILVELEKQAAEYVASKQ